MELIGHNHRSIKYKSLVQVIHVVAVVEEDGEEKELILDSVRRPLPIPYNEEQ